MMERLVTIIVPMYNAENTIEDCVKSICKSSYANLEIIIVDDGSTDDSLLICEKLRKQDERILVFHQENRGVSAARNFALKRANGYYLLFVDADDTIDAHMIERMVDYENTNNADLVIGGEGTERTLKENTCLTQEEAIKALFRGKLPLNTTAKLWKKSVIRDICFDEKICLAEDTLFLYEVLKKSRSIGYVKNAWYYIRESENSLSRNWNDTARIERTYRIFEDIEKDAIEYFPYAVKDIRNRKLNTLAVDLRMIDFERGDIRKREYLKIIRKNCFTFCFGGMTQKYKLAYLLTCMNPAVAKMVSKICRRRN